MASRRWLGALALAIALATAGGAQANNENWTNSIAGQGRQQGGLRLVHAGVICNNITAGASCMLDFGDTKSLGQGDLIVFFAPNEDQGFNCTSGICTPQTPGGDCGATTTFTLSTGPIRTAGSPAPPVGTTRDVATITSVTTASSATRYLSLNTRYTPLNRYLFIDGSLGVGCTANDLAIFIYDDIDTD